MPIFFTGIYSFFLPRKFYFRVPLRPGGLPIGESAPITRATSGAVAATPERKARAAPHTGNTSLRQQAELPERGTSD
jgi:hypothetical protein